MRAGDDAPARPGEARKGGCMVFAGVCVHIGYSTFEPVSARKQFGLPEEERKS